MRRIVNRSACVLLPAALICLGLALLIGRAVWNSGNR